MSLTEAPGVCRIRDVGLESSSLIASLLPAYLAELGVFEHYPYLDLYFIETDRYPFHIVVDEEVAGFALIRRHSHSATFELAEFYVRPPFRHRGIGASAVMALLAQFAGEWQIGVELANSQALAFWRKVLPPPVAEESTTSGQRCLFRLFVPSVTHAA
jgi:predicted acetyltransferase